MGERVITVVGASQHNLRDVDVTFGPGITAVVGTSGSGKSSLAFDTVYHEANRRFVETMAMGAVAARQRPAPVRSISGLGPAVAIAQNVLNRNPLSTVATALGVHPFLRILFSRFAEVRCGGCGTPVRALGAEERLAEARRTGGAVEVPLVRSVAGRHRRLLSLLEAEVGRAAITVDGRPWSGRALSPDAAHTIVVRTGEVAAGASPAAVRAALAAADGWGSHEVLVGGRPLLRSPICPGCGAWVPALPPTAFRPESAALTATHTIAGRTIDGALAGAPSELASFLDGAGLGPTSRRITSELRRRLDPLVALGLDHIALDRPMPTLSRGEAQRVRLAVVVAGRLEDLLHVLDEPSIGLHRRDVARLFDVLGRLPGPVVMVEHDAAAVASADDVVELGPGAGPDGGRLVFQGPPAALWDAGTTSGLTFSGRQPVARRSPRPAGDAFLTIGGAHLRNLAGVDCRFPVGRLTAVTGPSGAGKTTLVRDVLLASVTGRRPVGCEALEGPVTRALSVDQAPLGNNPRSNPATYTKVFDPIRKRFAAATGAPVSAFTFNRPEGACAMCEGMGAVEVSLRFLASTWIECDACNGTRYRPEVLALTADLGGRDLSIAEVLALPIDEAREVFAGDRAIGRVLDALARVGLGYLQLGQPSPTLSGGEAQRVRLARELAKAKAGDLIVLDEPTTGLHPADLAHLIDVLDGLAAKGCTVVVVEHQPDLVGCADWIIELGPGGGPAGGRLQHCGPPGAAQPEPIVPRTAPRTRPRSSDEIRVEGASAHNLRDVSVCIPKGRLTVVTGVSGSGKSSLVRDVLEAEATRRLLESLSMYERQGTREGPEAPVRSIDGLGPTVVLSSAHRWANGFVEGLNRVAATVGWASGVSRMVATVVARAGQRRCTACGAEAAVERVSPAPEAAWRCSACSADAPVLEPRHLIAQTPIAACPGCAGLGVVRRGDVHKLIVRPELPLCGGAMHSPGYYPKGYLCTPGTGGNSALVALAERHRFDPATTPWDAMSDEAQRAFLHGDATPLPTVDKRGTARPWRWRGVLTELSYWDQGGAFTTAHGCELCGGKRLRPEYLAMTLAGFDSADLHAMPISRLAEVVTEVVAERVGDDAVALEAASAAAHRLRFLDRVGLGYINLDRQTFTLSAGEAQRIRLASVLGSGLLGMTVLLDEPTRGLHPREVDALGTVLEELRDAGNTVVTVEHDPGVVRRADHVIEVGPGPGVSGGRITGEGPPTALPDGATAEALAGPAPISRPRGAPAGWLTLHGATEQNLRVDALRLPLGVLSGVCGVSGSGKSTLIVDTLGLALAPPKLTTSVAGDRYQPGAHLAIEGAPDRTVVADQSRAGIGSPGNHLGLIAALRREFARSDAAVAAGLVERDFGAGCDACSGGVVTETMGFLPTVTSECDACEGTGYRAEVRGVEARGLTLAQTERLTIDELAAAWSDVAAIGRGCSAAQRLGLGYLVVRQSGWSLSGGEAQRIKLARELAKVTTKPTLYLLDEPTAGLHLRDVLVLAAALDEVVGAGHSVLVVEHDPVLLAHCDWLVELGPGGGPDGGRIVAEGTPEAVAAGGTATAPYLRAVLA